jgi:hypothetical protein
MSIACINQLSHNIAASICHDFLVLQRLAISYAANGNLVGNFNSVFNHKGLYGFVISKNGIAGIVYVGKSECDDRLRQHLTGENKNGTPLASSVNTKHSNIKQAISNGFSVELALYASPYFTKSSLACLEIETINAGISTLTNTFPSISSWNQRIG